MRYPLIAGNWKMNKTISEAKDFVDEFKALYHNSDVRAVICAPYLQLPMLVEELKGTGVHIGAENCHYEENGAFTGEISIPMLKEVGITYCIVGHSERRQYYNEQDVDVNRKVKALIKNGIIPIICVGEDLYQREHNYQERLVKEQVRNALQDVSGDDARNVVIAYEPIWAIGTGKTATPIQAGVMCDCIRDELIELYDDEVADVIPILYGGSVNGDNISAIMENLEIDGALVGGASLVPSKFNEIINF